MTNLQPESDDFRIPEYSGPFRIQIPKLLVGM
jgi:hypothetical protein